MSQGSEQDLVMTIFERAAEQLGDITGLAMDLYYSRLPHARDSFERHGIGDLSRLEGGMVENAVYSLMYWLERREEIEIMLGHSFWHHEETLQVPVELFTGMIDAVADVVESTIPADAADERELWRRIAREIVDWITAFAATMH